MIKEYNMVFVGLLPAFLFVNMRGRDLIIKRVLKINQLITLFAEKQNIFV